MNHLPQDRPYLRGQVVSLTTVVSVIVLRCSRHGILPALVVAESTAPAPDSLTESPLLRPVFVGDVSTTIGEVRCALHPPPPPPTPTSSPSPTTPTPPPARTTTASGCFLLRDVLLCGRGQ